MPLAKTGSRAKFRHETVKSKRYFDPRSFRTVKARAHRVTIGCPRGEWDPKRKKCKVATQIQKILHPKGEYEIMAKGRNPRAKSNKASQSTLDRAELYAAKLYGQGMGAGSVTKALKKRYKSLSLADARYISGRVARIGRGSVKYRSKRVERLATFPLLRRNVKRNVKSKVANKSRNKKSDLAIKRAKNVTRNVRKKTNPRKNWYYGPSKQHRGKILVFSSARKPTQKSHSKYIEFAVGPFKNKDEAIAKARWFDMGEYTKFVM